MILYILLATILLYLFRNYVLKGMPMAAFFAALLFLAQPIHTEVVANVKSRDEILSLLFVCGTLLYALRFADMGRARDRILAAVCFFLALLSKEYGVVLVALLPLCLYVLRGIPLKTTAKSYWILAVPLVVYLAMRMASVTATADNAEAEIMNNPYLYATTPEKWATILLVLVRYLQLLVWPATLSADYSFNQIPYTHFTDPMVWLSIGLYAAIAVAGVYAIRKRHPLALAAPFYLLFVALVCNVLANIGAPMGERLVFHSSVGVALVAGWLLGRLWDAPQGKTGKLAAGALVVLLVGLSGFRTITRNRDWYNDGTLFLRDVQTCPNSLITNCNAGAAMLDRADTIMDPVRKQAAFNAGLGYLNKAIRIHPRYMLAYINRGIIYLRSNDFEHALSDCDTVVKYYPQHPVLAYLSFAVSDHFDQAGKKSAGAGDNAQAVDNFRKAVSAMPGDADLWYNLGYALYTGGQPEPAQKAFAHCLSIRPNHPQARNMMALLQKK
jgi:tetratricopeptide (TPR) repeat protein